MVRVTRQGRVEERIGGSSTPGTVFGSGTDVARVGGDGERVASLAVAVVVHDRVRPPARDEIVRGRRRDDAEDEDGADGDGRPHADREDVVVLGPPGEVALLDVDLGQERRGDWSDAATAVTQQRNEEIPGKRMLVRVQASS